jgi:hypothetical protein
MSSTPPKCSPIVSRRSFLGMASATATGLSMGRPALARPKREVLALSYFTSHVPELVDQYVCAFEKVWAHRDSLGRS